MTLFSAPIDQGAALRSRYLAESVLSASPARLLTMLYDRLLLDLGRAETAQENADWGAASEQLLHAQAIVTELTSSLNVEVWDGADALLGLYNYVSTALMNANIRHDPALTREAITLLEPLRQTWHEAAAVTVAPPTVPGQAMPTTSMPATSMPTASVPGRLGGVPAWESAGAMSGSSLGFG